MAHAPSRVCCNYPNYFDVLSIVMSLKNNRHNQFGFKIISAKVGIFLLLINDPIRINYKTKNYEKSEIKQ